MSPAVPAGAMRVLFTVSHSPGNWSSMVPLGWALRARGHEVRVVCAPAQSEAVARAGLTPVPVLEAEREEVMLRAVNCVQAQRGQWRFAEPPPHPETGLPLESADSFDAMGWYQQNWPRLAELSLRGSDAAVEFARWWRPQLVVHDLMSVEGPLIGKVLDVPALLHLWGPVGPHDGEEVGGARPFLPVDFSQAFARHGLAPLSPDTYEHMIDPCPEALAAPVPVRRHPVRHVPYNGSGAMPPWRPEPRQGAARPRVGVVWSTSATETFGPVSFAVPKVVEALAELDVDVVLTLTAGDRRRVGELPAHMTALENAPLHLLLPECDLVVHHGGAGCTMTGLAAGIPQLILPNGWDQELMSERVAGAGAALALHNATADADDVRSAVTRLLGDDGHRKAAQRLRREMEDQPDPVALVTALEELAAGAPLVAN
ncbi:nucleotide disphospho-sugar-binding domain-containing protein [Streptomyces sp. NPDC053079]|uniref:nucleotide disphospho-sugar-binding domain-containing protein n=1 Tax=Streptomyces sp. NPDC053079 TaxID=3365697 RepID=UPI000A9217D5